MAFRPSKRSSRTVQDVELNLFPMLNLMSVLIPLLLSVGVAIKVSVINLDLPRAAGGSISQSAAAYPQEAQKNLDLSVTITAEGFYLASSQAVLQSSDNNGPSIPMNANGQYDYQALTKKLYEVKQRIAGTNLNSKKIIIQSEPEIEYQILISTLDAARTYFDGKNKIEMFPEVSISTGIL
jgi:biopolymer transport protein ExbD